MMFFALLLAVSSDVTVAADARIETIFGTGRAEANSIGDPRATNVGFPFGVEFGPDRALYICEVTNHRIWRLDPDGKRLTVTAGTGERGYAGDGGPATAARLNEPYEVRFDSAGNMYFVEMQNHVVRRVDRQTGRISTIAGTGTAGFGGDGGPATEAQLRQPHSIALDERGHLYIADIGNHRIRRVKLVDGVIETIAGDGRRQLPVAGQRAAGTPVAGPRALFVTGRTLWVALREGHSVWKLDLDTGRWIHVAGTGQPGDSGDGGPAAEATFNGPKGIALDRSGNIFIADTENEVIRRIDGATHVISTLAGAGPSNGGYSGDGGPATGARLNRPHGICVSADGQQVVIGDTENHRVRQVTLGP
jgi:sugar lactone lactonase YvrE